METPYREHRSKNIFTFFGDSSDGTDYMETGLKAVNQRFSAAGSRFISAARAIRRCSMIIVPRSTSHIIDL